MLIQCIDSELNVFILSSNALVTVCQQLATVFELNHVHRLSVNFLPTACQHFLSTPCQHSVNNWPPCLNRIIFIDFLSTCYRLRIGIFFYKLPTYILSTIRLTVCLNWKLCECPSENQKLYTGNSYNVIGHQKAHSETRHQEPVSIIHWNGTLSCLVSENVFSFQ